MRHILGYMGYQEKLQKLCALKGLDQSALASKLGLSKSSISRIMSGSQEPKLSLAYELAKALGVTLDYLADKTLNVGPTDQLLMVTDDELTILKMARRLGTNVALDRLLNVGTGRNLNGESGTSAKVGVENLGEDSSL